jgi:transcriptional regulator with XRE-family HTH domain
MTLGYSIHAADSIRTADPNKIGVALGRKCLDHGIPAAQVAADLGVSRQTVYNWFFGRLNPSTTIHDKVQAYLDSLG